MDFKRLGYFALIAELGSLSKTSGRIGIAQPSLSRQMRLLEAELGVALFTRVARGMMLTEAGEMLYARIAAPLRAIGQAIDEVRALPADAGGSVVFGMPPTMIRMFAGSLARRAAAFAPDIELRLVDAYSGHLLEWLQRGELDGAILYGPAPAGLNAIKLLEDELVLVGSAPTPLAVDGTIECRHLQELPLILSSAAHGLRFLIETAAAKARIKLNVRLQTDSYQLLHELVESGVGQTILPYCAVKRQAAAGRLVITRIVRPTITRELFLALGSSSRAALQVRDLIREEVAALAGHNDDAVFRIGGPCANTARL